MAVETNLADTLKCNYVCATLIQQWPSPQPFSPQLMTPTKTRPHKPLLAEWTSDILSSSHPSKGLLDQSVRLYTYG